MHGDKFSPIYCDHENELEKKLKKEDFRKAYEALEEEFTLVKSLLRAREKAHMTQNQVAERMGTLRPAVARIESIGFRKVPSPSFNTLKRYAHAVGCKLEVKLVAAK
ncbi:MAG TPA: transcriptional regulator [Lentisphaeria bacterium]|nr:MAG: hypothetical protein A2X45_16255 [Lentisphaerae bacterium GWF2_50_93]HCE45935.1 transcriptional regulator [Lentisphaeria bacterium]